MIIVKNKKIHLLRKFVLQHILFDLTENTLICLHWYNIDLWSKHISSIKKKKKRSSSNGKQSSSFVGHHRPRRSRHRRSPGTVVTPTTRSSSFRPDRKPRNPRRPDRTPVSAPCAGPRTCSRDAIRATRATARPATTWITSTRSERATSAEGSWLTTRAETDRHCRRRGRTCWILRQCHRHGGIANPRR